ncbi:MAG: PQQ-dependent sugar dehydrogenase [bacterium]|nr:PQQ-dependent sugar dehydrogenase [bacterium]
MDILKSKALLITEFFIVLLCISLILMAGLSNKSKNPNPKATQPPSAISQSESTSYSTQNNTTGLPLSIPKGFALSNVVTQLKSPRVILIDPKQNILISDPGDGKIYLSRDDNKNQKPIAIISNLNKPHGLELLCIESKCTLFIAESDNVSKYDYTLNSDIPIISNKQKILDLPQGGNHISRSIKLYKGKLLVSIGSSCNVCIESDKRRGAVLIVDLDGKNIKIFASGLRNSVFMVNNPFDDSIWATEMGRDLIGDDIPPDEVNVLKEGQNYGWPMCYGSNVHDSIYDTKNYLKNPCDKPEYIPSQVNLQAHSAPLGLAFIPNTSEFDEGLRNNLLVAYHGSWNRSKKTGYKIVKIKLDEAGEYVSTEDFITGWLDSSNKVLGRPVDIKFNSKNNSFYISDDKLGVVYKLALTK